MPVTYVHIEWPGAEKDQVYSPSSVIQNYFKPEEELSITAFSKVCNEGLMEASERVRQKFGYACSSAQMESIRITEKCKSYQQEALVKILSIK